jgi:hypothetical protein
MQLIVVPYDHREVRDARAPVCALREERGEVMIGWYPDWQTAVAWLVVTAIATVIYFGPMTRLIDFGN